MAIKDNRIFLAQRPIGGAHGGLWEFPGGKVEANETPEAALQRELREELGAEVEVNDALEAVEDGRIRLKPYRVRFLSAPQAIEAQAICWATKEEARGLPMPPCDQGLLTYLFEKVL